MLGLKLNHVSKRGHCVVWKHLSDVVMFPSRVRVVLVVWQLDPLTKAQSEALVSKKARTTFDDSLSWLRYSCLSKTIVYHSDMLTRKWPTRLSHHYGDVLMGAMASRITSLAIVYSTVYAGTDQRKHQSSASLAFVGNSPVTGEFPAKRSSNAENVFIWWRHHDDT